MQAKKAKAKLTNTSGLQLPVSAAPSLYDYSALQKDVGFFGFGDKAKKAASKAGSVAQDVKSNASSVADKASDVADQVSVRTASLLSAGNGELTNGSGTFGFQQFASGRFGVARHGRHLHRGIAAHSLACYSRQCKHEDAVSALLQMSSRRGSSGFNLSFSHSIAEFIRP